MGNKPTRKWQRIHLYLTGCLMGAFLFAGCATGLWGPGDHDPSIIVERHLALGECRLLQGNYEAARRECETVLAQFSGRPDARAHYLLGMVLVHPDNPMQDTHRAAACFQRVVDRHPDSDLVAASQTWLAVIARLEENRRIAERMESASEEMEKQLKTEKNNRIRLEERLQQMKAIDLTVE